MNLKSVSWLSDVAVFNESDEYAVPGDVSIFRNIEEMCSEMEAWMVENGGIGFSLNGLGQTIKLELDGENAVGVVVDTSEPDLATLRTWLRSAAESVQKARAIKSRKKPHFFGRLHRSEVLKHNGSYRTPSRGCWRTSTCRFGL